MKKNSSKPSRSKTSRALAAQQGYFKTSDGVQLYFEDSGGDAPVLFYIYGLACSIKHWKYSLSYFDLGGGSLGQRRQVWFDFRGHGRSEPPRPGQRLTLELIARDIKELCDYLGIEKATFLGQSMGGSVALILASLYPGLVSGLVLLTSPGRDPTERLPMQPIMKAAWLGGIALNNKSPKTLQLIYSTLILPMRRIPGAGVPLREIVRYMGFNPNLSRTDDIEEYITKVLELNPNLFYQMAEDMRSFDVAKLSASINMPALVVAGAKDRVIPLKESRRLASLLPASELAVVKHGSHCPHFDDPGLVNRLIEDFLQRRGL